MNAQDAHLLFAYDAWANGRLLEAASRLGAHDFVRDLGASFGSVRGTLLHIMWGERRHLQFWRDGTRIDDPKVDDFPDAESLRSVWSIVERERKAFVETLSDDGLAAQLTVRGKDFRLHELVQHVVNHSTYHRGQVVLLLRQLGQTPPATDFALFLLETR